ncbi:MAG: hypothetical protein K6C68_01150 [Ruminococcus sp.]|nr:hypothetical protein [Ruminococcus sp.]
MEKAITKIKLFKRGLKGELSDFMLKIISIIIAVIIWFAMSITKYPTVKRTIIGVPVNFSISGTTAESKGLSALSYKDFTVEVEIQGMNYEIGTYDADDLIATINTDEVTKEGTYKLDIDVKSKHTADKCTIISVNPPTKEIKFDRLDTVKMPMTVSAPNVSAQEGFTLKETSLTPSEIEISGPEKELERIDKVVAEYTGQLTLDDDMTVSTDSIILYDADSNRLDTSNCTMSLSTVDISFVVYKKVTMNLAASFLNVPDGFDLDSLPYSLSTKTLQVITPQLDAQSTEDVQLNPISMYEITKGKVFKTEIDSILSNGEINQSGDDMVEVDFDLTDYSQKTFTLKASKIEIRNVPEGKKASIDNELISNVTIIGPSKVMENLKASDLTAYIDLSDAEATGSISHELIIYCKSRNNVWNIGTHEAVVTISENAANPSGSPSDG